jgi:hypothetical protein
LWTKGGGVADGVQHVLQGGPVGGGADGGPPGSAPGEVVQVFAFGVVEVQGAGDAVQDAVGGPRQVAALESHVVVERDAGQQCDLLAAQPFHPPVTAKGGQPGLLGGDAGAAGDEELPDLGAVVHVRHGRREPRDEAGTGITWNGRHCHRQAQQRSLEPEPQKEDTRWSTRAWAPQA